MSDTPSPTAHRAISRLTPAFLSPLAIITAMALIAVAGFDSAILGHGFLAPAGLGAAGAALVVAVAHRRRWFLGEAAAASCIAFALLGTIAVQGAPSPNGYRSFFDGLVNGWADLLSSSPPANLTPELRVLPYTVAWASVALGGELWRRVRHPVLPAAGPLVGLIVTLLITVEDRRLASFQGATMAVGALLLGIVTGWRSSERHRPFPNRLSGHHRSRGRTLIWSFILLSMVATGAPLAGPRLPLAGARERVDLRQHQQRPWDPLALPSPLVTLKASLKEGRSDDIVFSVLAENALARWPLAVLGDYDGSVWTVADEQADAASRFIPVDSRLPGPPDEAPFEESAEFTIEIGTLAAPWIPSAGWPATVTLNEVGELRMNPATGTLAAPWRSAPGGRITMSALSRPELTLDQLHSATVLTNDEDGELDFVPPPARDLAGDIFEGEDPGMDQILALADAFVSDGFYDYSDDSRPGHSLGRLAEFLDDPERIVGYDEQYAAAAGLLARIGGVPARVVVGYLIAEDRYRQTTEGLRADVAAEDITAWIEVETTEHGWVPITVTPDRTREPQEQEQGVTIEDIAIPNPPPPPPPPPGLTPPAQSNREETPDEEETGDETPPGLAARVPVPVLVAGSALGVPISLLSAGTLIVLLAKARLTARRRVGNAGQRIEGAWSELTDRYGDAGIEAAASGTPSEVIEAFVAADPAVGDAAPQLRHLADQVDRARFHPTGPTEEHANHAWESCDQAVAVLRASRSRWERICMRTDPRPLSRRRPGTNRRLEDSATSASSTDGADARTNATRGLQTATTSRPVAAGASGKEQP